MAGELSPGSFDIQRQRRSDCAEIQAQVHRLSIAVVPAREARSRLNPTRR
jgi:hypothetical protein